MNGKTRFWSSKGTELQDKLEGIGFSEQEARVYIFLVKGGPMKAKEVAQAVKLNKVMAYRYLRKLQSQGIIESSLDNPAFFKAVPVEKVVEMFVEAKETEARDIKNRKET